MAVSGLGTVFIQLDKGSYSPGEQVNGTIFLSVIQNYSGASELWLTISGMEDTKLIEQKTRTEHYTSNGQRRTRTHTYYVTHQDYNTFFNHRFPIYRFNSSFVPAGQYTFPISFILNSGLPSTFNYSFYKHGSCHANVNYVIQASIGGGMGSRIPSIQCSQNLTVNQELLISSGTMRKELNKEIKTWCCVSKGHSKITTYFEKNDYVPGEQAYIITEVDNSKGKADILQIKGIFRQHLRITARGYSELIKEDHQTTILNGIKAGELLVGENAKRLEVNLRTKTGSVVQPTCRGKLVSNEYLLVNKLKVDACLCCDHNPSCDLVLNVRNQDVQYQKWGEKPSNWNPQVMSAFNIQFTSEYSNPTMPPPSSDEFSGTSGMPGMPPGPGMPGMPPGPGMPGMPGMPPGPGMPGMDGMPPGPGMPHQNYDQNRGFPSMPPGFNGNSGMPQYNQGNNNQSGMPPNYPQA